MKKIYIVTIFSMLLCLISCNSKKGAAADTAQAAKPVAVSFDADSAYAFCEAQCAFGPRTMNSEAHDKCGEWIKEKFRQYGMSVTTQEMTLNAYDGTPLKCTNIIASYKPELTTRILL